jgi:hypothetical protein
MLASFRQPLEATVAIAVCVCAACYFAPTFTDDGPPIEALALPYAFAGVGVGVAIYFGLWLNGQNWRHPRFTFSIREIVLLTLVVALICGWAVDRSKLRREQWIEVEHNNNLSYEVFRLTQARSGNDAS